MVKRNMVKKTKMGNGKSYQPKQEEISVTERTDQTVPNFDLHVRRFMNNTKPAVIKMVSEFSDLRMAINGDEDIKNEAECVSIISSAIFNITQRLMVLLRIDLDFSGLEEELQDKVIQETMRIVIKNSKKDWKKVQKFINNPKKMAEALAQFQQEPFNDKHNYVG